MAKIVCVDALVYLNGDVLAERNEATVSFDVDIAEARPFVPSPSQAFVHKAATWKDGSISLSGYFSDGETDDAIDLAIQGGTYSFLIYPRRSVLTQYWKGNVIINSLEHTITSEDFSELNFEGSISGAPTWVHP